MRIVKLNKNNQTQIFRELIKNLNRGALNVIPSDTVYGLAVDAGSENAVKRLIDFKSRPAGRAISVFVGCLEEAKKYVVISPDQEKIINQRLPAALTMVLQSKHKLAQSLESEKGTLGIRIVQFDFITELVKRFGRPITATSANLTSRSAHYSVPSLLKSLSSKKKSQLDLVVDWGRLKRNKPSTVVDLTSPNLKILRRGDVLVDSYSKFISLTPTQTKKSAQSFIIDLLKRHADRPIVILIEGELGVGKTLLIKGIGEYLGIKNIISPTYVISYEYQVAKKPIKNFYHLDLYRLAEKEEFDNLGVMDMLKPGNLICIEWGEKSGDLIETFKTKAQVVYIKMKYLDKERREIKYENISH